LLLLDQGMRCEAIAKVLFLDDDTIRTWHRLYREDGIEGLAGFGHEGSACGLSDVQQGRGPGRPPLRHVAMHIVTYHANMMALQHAFGAEG